MLSGLSAAAALFLTTLANIILPFEESQRATIWLVILGLAMFTSLYHGVLYYLQEKGKAGSGLSIIPDLAFVAIITSVMSLTGEHAYVFVIVFLIMIAIDAFIFSLSEVAILIFAMIFGIIFGNYQALGTIPTDVVFELIGIITLGTAVKVFSEATFTLKEKESNLEQEILELEADKREIKNLLESLSDGLFVVNAKNRITFYNHAALNILGMVASPGEILDRDVNDFLPTIGPNGPESVTKEAFGNFHPVLRDDFRIVRPNGVIRLHANVTPVLSDNAKLQGAVIFFRDISKEKQLDEQRSEFNAIASHELRTPLTIIEGYLFFLLDPSSGAKYDKLTRDYVEKAHTAAKGLINLISDVLTVIRADEGRLSVTLEKVNIQRLAEKVVKDMESNAKEKGLKINFKLLGSSFAPEITTDSGKVKQILTNLTENAIKFTEKGGVTIELGLLEKEVLLNVVDTGAGIDDQDQKLIFQKFYRAEDWKTRKAGGTGLGLYISKILTERLGGKIGVQSQKGKGSRFYLTLPLEFPKEIGLEEAKIKIIR